MGKVRNCAVRCIRSAWPGIDPLVQQVHGDGHASCYHLHGYKRADVEVSTYMVVAVVSAVDERLLAGSLRIAGLPLRCGFAFSSTDSVDLSFEET